MLRSVDAGPDISASVERLALGPLRSALAGIDAYLVGGAVRDLLRGADPGPDVDIAVDGDLEAVLAGLDPDPAIEVEAIHARFATATVAIAGRSFDLARTRSETYPAPGALPVVAAATIGADLARRDFSVNAMALSLHGDPELLDPFDGRADLRSRTLRTLHDRSLIDDPTRAIRAARYASRLDLEPDPETLGLLRETDLATVSGDRRAAELDRLAAEPTAVAGFELLARWGVLALPPGATALMSAIERLAASAPWAGRGDVRRRALLLAAGGGERAEAAARLAAATPERPSEAVRLAAAHSAEELLLASAAGGEWVADYLSEWSSTRLEIDGADLIAAGVPEGPAIGAGLRGALERKLDGGLTGGREAELALALEIARASVRPKR